MRKRCHIDRVSSVFAYVAYILHMTLRPQNSSTLLESISPHLRCGNDVAWLQHGMTAVWRQWLQWRGAFLGAVSVCYSPQICPWAFQSYGTEFRSCSDWGTVVSLACSLQATMLVTKEQCIVCDEASFVCHSRLPKACISFAETLPANGSFPDITSSSTNK